MEEDRPIRFLSYNIHGCVGWDRRETPELTLDVIRKTGADVVALQEVYDNDDAALSFLRGLETLPHEALVYGPTLRRHPGSYGNVLVSRFPVPDLRRVDLSVGGREPRGAIWAVLQTPHGPVTLVSGHLGLSRAERAAQFRTLDGLFGAGSGGPASAAEILMGDFNEWAPWSRRIRALRRGFDACSRARTFPSVLPLFALDRICVRGRGVTVRFGGLRISGAGRASDHRPVVADVAFGAGGGRVRVREFRRSPATAGLREGAEGK